MAELAETLDYGELAAEHMAELVRDGVTPRDAASAVHGLMLKDGSAWELFVQHGAMLVYDMWRRHGATAAQGTAIRPRRRVADELPLGQRAPEGAGMDLDEFVAGDIDQVDSIYQAPLKVDGEWTTLGSLSRRQCRAMQFFFDGRVAQAQHLAQFFKRLADGLGDKQTVRKHWSEMQLRTIYAELGT